jgi:hypothetical protein
MPLVSQRISSTARVLDLRKKLIVRLELFIT